MVGVKISNTFTFFRKKKLSLTLYFVEMDPDQQARNARSGSAKMMTIRPDPDPEFVTT